jgi:hypothetical protein
MSAPSNLPSAWQVAQDCVERYRQITGTALPERLADDIELLAEHFFGRNELQNVLLRQLIDWSEFSRRPANKGHDAVADFLAARLLAVALSTNLDTLIERAASTLGEPDFYPWVEAEDINRSQHPHSPLVKLHGCANRTRWETLWCKQQMEEQPLKDRIKQLAAWVQGHFPNRDLLVVGFWTDWGYLNQILAESVVSTEPRSVIVVDPSAKTNLKKKSPVLWKWATNNASFTHVKGSGDAFLDELRHIVSSHFIRGVWEQGRSIYENIMSMNPPAIPDGGLSELPTDSLYRIRRDLTGVPMNSVVREKTVGKTHSFIGLLHLALFACGAKLSSNSFEWIDDSIRIVNAPNYPLSSHFAHSERVSRAT